MLNVTEKKEQTITQLLNGTIKSIKSIVPLKLNLQKPVISGEVLKLKFGVLIGITGDAKGKMVITGDTETFGIIGETMFGMPLEGDMLVSFSGELGNMIAGGLSTNINEQGIITDITSPTILQGNTTLTGYEKALRVPISIENAGALNIYLLLD
ncbi:chemotaxis protein CheX [Anaerobacillus arseniciselenatis]|uniref:chemotaxis protein CheX n=1 Tax=Anaerobacillus arseniciselenatis TaxID=85682 RepID=UPI000B05F8C1|nr:chemotaxis protein CheX [Anaerobacillus arseniciselenatis]